MPTFMFADIAGFTALTEAHGDADASVLAHRFEALVGERLPEGARLIKMMGDAAMVVGDDALPIVLAARSLVSGVDELPGRPAVRIGIHCGDAVERGGDYWGHAVNVAARLAARAGPSEILVTDVVRAAIVPSMSSGDLVLEPLGRQRLRNVSESLELFVIRAGPAEFVTDPVCRMRLPDLDGVASVRFEQRTYHFCSLDCTRKFVARPEAYATEG